MKKGLTLIELLVSIFLFSIIFAGIFGAFLLGFRILGMTEKKVTALSIAQGEIEKIKNLPYLQVGTVGAQLPYASGTLEKISYSILNGKEYKIERKIKYIFDPSDGEEECPLDYKKVEISVSFSGILGGEIVLSSEIVPRDKTEEINSCLSQPAGILSVQVLNSKGEFVSLPEIEIFDPETQNLVDKVVPVSGKYDFPLNPKSYKVVVSKKGYSREETFGGGEIYNSKVIAIPSNPHPIVFEGKITQVTFYIDKSSSMEIETLSTFGQGFFSDSFLDESKISEKFNIFVFGGKATLATDSEGYLPSGNLLSVEISPQDLIEWQDFSFLDEKPTGTELKYQIFYASGTEWFLIPDNDLPGNSEGFSQSPINLKNLSTSTYSRLKLKANFSTNFRNLSPVLFEWQISWKSKNPILIPNVSFSLRGGKIVGKDANEEPIYKFSTTTQTDSNGKIKIENLEWDLYYFSNFEKEGLPIELVNSEPQHPISLLADQNLKVSLYLQSQNSLLVTVLDDETLQPVFSATVFLRGENFSQVQQTGSSGQTIFLPLSKGNYTLSVEASNYYSTSTELFVSGKNSKVIKISPSD